MTDNKIQTIAWDSFEGAHRLLRIHLSNNNISSIARDAFVKFPKLECVDLSKSSLQSINDAFRNNNKLNLNLRDNPISSLSHELFSTASVQFSLDKLEYLISKDCGEHRFHVVLNGPKDGLFPSLSGNYEIHCREQSLKQLKYFASGRDTFDDALKLMKCFGPSLRMLDLSNYPIGGKLNAGTFDRFRNISFLSLSNSSITEFDFNLLNHQKKLKHLHISSNGLKRLGNISLLRNFKLRSFLAAENRLDNIHSNFGLVRQLCGRFE